MNTIRRRVGGLALITVLLANGGAAFAAPPKPAPKAPSAATKSYDEAQRQLAAGNYEVALALYSKLSNVESRRGAALALDKPGRTDEAIAEYQKFLASAPPALQEQANTARARVVELTAAKTVKVRVVTTPPGATSEIAGQPASGKTSPADVDLSPGKHIVRATLRGAEPGIARDRGGLEPAGGQPRADADRHRPHGRVPGVGQQRRRGQWSRDEPDAAGRAQGYARDRAPRRADRRRRRRPGPPSASRR